MNLQALLVNANNSLNNELPFVIYRKPNTEIVQGLFGTTSEVTYLRSFEEQGFVFAPFSTAEETIVFPFSKFNKISTSFKHIPEIVSENKYPVNENDKERYIKLIKKTISCIKNGEAEKIVVSRNDEIALKDFDFSTVFQRMLLNYKNAFVYGWYHPKIGLWMGATPERLLEIENNQFKTTALAGTMPFKGSLDVTWGEKELEEQQIVTNYILEAIKGQVNEISLKGPYSVQAGKLLHLKTDIQGILKDKGLLYLISRLHPTPAVCGMPKEEAKVFILKNEGYNRCFYTGFLGELNFNHTSSLYVNLRCMKISKNNAFVYVGGGITKDSVAENEWDETVKKAATMKSVL